MTEYLSSPVGLKSIIQIYETFFIYPNDFSFIFVEMQGFEPWSKELTNMFHSQAYPIFLNWQIVSPLLFIESASRTLYSFTSCNFLFPSCHHSYCVFPLGLGSDSVIKFAFYFVIGLRFPI